MLICSLPFNTSSSIKAASLERSRWLCWLFENFQTADKHRRLATPLKRPNWPVHLSTIVSCMHISRKTLKLVDLHWEHLGTWWLSVETRPLSTHLIQCTGKRRQLFLTKRGAAKTQLCTLTKWRALKRSPCLLSRIVTKRARHVELCSAATRSRTPNDLSARINVFTGILVNF